MLPGGRPVYTNVSPEGGAFLGNQMATTAMFAHSASDAPFASGSALGAVVVEPQAQLTYNRYDAGKSTLQGTTLKSSGDNSINTRAGVRVYPLGKPGAASTVTPFLEANWLRNTGSPRVNMGAGNLSAVPMRNAAELKLGAQGRIGKSVIVSGQVSGQAGSESQRGYGGMLNLTYRW